MALFKTLHIDIKLWRVTYSTPCRRVFKRKQRGKIGLALNGDWYEPKPAADLGEQRKNEKAAERALEFTVGWFARPVYQVGDCIVWLAQLGVRIYRLPRATQRCLPSSLYAKVFTAFMSVSSAGREYCPCS